MRIGGQLIQMEKRAEGAVDAKVYWCDGFDFCHVCQNSSACTTTRIKVPSRMTLGNTAPTIALEIPRIGKF